MKQSLGFIGLGLMGAPMAARLLNAGYPLHLYNRTKEKCTPLREKGAQIQSSPAAVAAHADIVFTMVTDDHALKSIAAEIQSALKSGGIHIDCSTVSPALTSSLEKEYTASGRHFLHSPVLGSIPQATDGSLLLFVGGEESAFTQSKNILNVLGQKIWRFSKAAQASSMKLVMNSFIAGMIATLSQAIVFVQNAGIEGATLLEVLNHSALNTPMYQTKGASILSNNFSPRFFLEYLLKDTNLFRDAAQLYSARSPIADTVKNLLDEAVSRGFGKEDYSAIVKILK